MRSDSYYRDKHWAALEEPISNPNRVQFVHNLDPLRIITCDSSFQCLITYQEGSDERNKFDDMRDHIRGGTQFIEYQKPYFIGFAHVTLFETPAWSRYYTMNMVVLKKEMNSATPYRIVYVSHPVEIDKRLMKSIPIVRYQYIREPFYFP